MSVRFSVCVPNFNYAHYLGETLRTVLDQSYADLEVVVCDNASTDSSVELVRGIDDPRVQLAVNRQNVGFSGNLDRAVGPSSGQWVLLLSSDDLIMSDALSTYNKLIEGFEDKGTPAVLAASSAIIDSTGTRVGQLPPAPWGWADAIVDERLSAQVGARVLRMPARELLRRALISMRNPLPFLATAYRRTDYDAIEGYRANALINPDKDFALRLLGQVDEALFVDKPLFAYRVHASNQTAQQDQAGALKYLMDEYRYTFDLSDDLLGRAGLTRAELQTSFMREDIERRALAALVEGHGLQVRRILNFGKAAYPAVYRKRPAMPAIRLASRVPRLAKLARPLRSRFVTAGAQAVETAQQRAMANA